MGLDQVESFPERPPRKGLKAVKSLLSRAAPVEEANAGTEVKAEAFPDLEELAPDTVKSKLKRLRDKMRGAIRMRTHEPVPVVGTFEELLRFAKIASLNSAIYTNEHIETFFSCTDEEAMAIDLPSVKQRVVVATNHKLRLHTISFRGTTNLANVVQNIRLSNNPIRASGKLASVGRSLSGVFAGVRSSTKMTNTPETDESCSGSGSFDEDDECRNIAWNAPLGERQRLGCTDHLPMHRGYRLVARECRDAIAPLLKEGYAVQLTGHSLGGAVAVAVALLYKAAGQEVVKVVTFGAPKLGPKETREAADGLNVLRVVQKDDIIPLLPMSRPFVRKPYVHLGDGIMLDNNLPGRYAPLGLEWGSAGILWRHRAHTGYAASTAESSAAIASWMDGEQRDVLVSADDPDGGPPLDFSGDGVAGQTRWGRAKERLASLRAALREGVAARRARKGATSSPISLSASTFPAGTDTADASGAGDSSSDISLALRALPMSQTEWAAEVAEWAHAPHDHTEADPAPFDDMEGELFVQMAETEGGATAAAAAAATEWEKAASRAAFTSAPAHNTGFASPSASTFEKTPAFHAGPTIFERLWELRRLPAQERVDRLECHRMKRYVAAIEAVINAGPDKTTIDSLYARP